VLDSPDDDMNQPGHANVRILVPEQVSELLDLPARVVDAPSPASAPHETIRRVAEIVGTRVALICLEDLVWTVLAEAGEGPAIPNLTGGIADALRRVGDGSVIAIESVQDGEDDWTLVGLTRRSGAPAVLMLHRDWTLSHRPLAQLAHSLLLAQRAYALAASARVRIATHRLSRALSRVSGFREVSAVAVRNAARAVNAQLATLAVTDADHQELEIMATHGYPLTLVEHLRIPRGVGVIGSVFESRMPLRVRDVSTFNGIRRRRARYRTNSFAAVPIITGQDVLGVLCVTDRADGRAFSHADLSALRTLASTMALALERERARAQADSYAQAAAIDPVSGLFNRRYFHARLDEELQRAHRHGLSVGLLMIDVDDFKAINDRFGHLVGDTVIRDLADILKRSVRVFDVCTRFGGEEFAVVMPGSGGEDAARIANRIRERIEQYRPTEIVSTDLKITVSIGLCVATPGTAARDLINTADQALYVAKRAGKNQVRTGTVIS
jgi:diguanylate cyclase (GGDEF)-like protein